MNKKSILLLVLSYLLSTTFVSAQQQLHSYTLSEVWQNNRLNPANVTDDRWVIGLPNFHNNLNTTGLTWAEIIGEKPDGTRGLIIGENLDQLEMKNSFREHFRLETLSLGYKNKADWQWSGHHAIIGNIYTFYPGTLVKLIWGDKAQFIGRTVSLEHEIDAYAYQELGLGIAKRLENGLQIGGRIKLLNGIGSIFTERSTLELTTIQNVEEVNLQADYQLQSASLLEYDGFGEFNLSNLGSSVGNLVSRNFGYAFDFGLQMELEEWSVSVSILDIGKIIWKNETSNYAFAGAYDYSGLEVIADYLENEITFEVATDSLRHLFDVVETDKQYSTALPSKIYTQISYAPFEQWQFSAVLHGAWLLQEFYASVAIVARYQPLENLHIGTSYAIYEGNYDNFGGSVVLRLGAAQLFLVTNNISNIFRWKKSENSDLELGMSLLLK